eukprot:SAG11_NODE_1718_length_4382_cov_2.032687_3_plen_713_part_00
MDTVQQQVAVQQPVVVQQPTDSKSTGSPLTPRLDGDVVATASTAVGAEPAGMQSTFDDEIRKMGDLESSDDEAEPTPRGDSSLPEQSATDAVDEPSPAGVEEEWVQCEAEGCGKWRLLPPNVSADKLPDVFFCAMNYWKPADASCDVPEQSSETSGSSEAADGGDDLTVDSDDEFGVTKRRASRRSGRRASRPTKRARSSNRSKWQRKRRAIADDEDLDEAEEEETGDAEDEEDKEDEEDDEDPWALISTWQSVEFSGESEDKEEKGGSTAQGSWWDCLVLDYNEMQNQHLVRWCGTDAEEWVAALRRSECRASASHAEEKCRPVLFDNNVALVKPKLRPDLVGRCFQVRKPVAITVAAARDSAEVGSCEVKQVLKVLAAIESDSGQVRIMTQHGWVSVASRKGHAFLKQRPTQLYLDKNDRRAIKRNERHAREAEAADAAAVVARKLEAETVQMEWVAAIKAAKQRAARRRGEILPEDVAEAAAAEAAAAKVKAEAEAAEAEVAASPSRQPARHRPIRRRTMEEDDDEAEEENLASELLLALILKTCARRRFLRRRCEAAVAAKASGLAAVILQTLVRVRQAQRELGMRQAAAKAAAERELAIRHGLYTKADVQQQPPQQPPQQPQQPPQQPQQPPQQPPQQAATVAAEEGIDWGAVDFGTLEAQAVRAHTIRAASASQTQQTEEEEIDWAAVDFGTLTAEAQAVAAATPR